MNVRARVYYVTSLAYLDVYYCLHSGILISESDLLHFAKFGGLGVNYLEVKLTPSSEIKMFHFLCWIQSPDGDTVSNDNWPSRHDYYLGLTY